MRRGFSTLLKSGRYTHRRVAAGSSTGTVQQVQHIQVNTGAGTEPAAKTCCVAEEELILLATRFLIDAGCIPQTTHVRLDRLNGFATKTTLIFFSHSRDFI